MVDLPKGELACSVVATTDFFGGDPKTFGAPDTLGAGDPKAPTDGVVPNGDAGCFPGADFLVEVPKGSASQMGDEMQCSKQDASFQSFLSMSGQIDF